MFKSNKQGPQEVTTGRFELEQEGQLAYLEYSIDGKILTLLHTEVPPKLRGAGLASELAKTALQWARDNEMKVDVVCPMVGEYLKRHPEFAHLRVK